ncbi:MULTISPECIES: GGDEF domain-containing protein [unclassified Clostridium]|uniref:GGDEF domain-containing protein n=1 Tax=unclassified Clostridium TaxID=2614128 RepID=UPI000297EA59|nr:MULTISPECIES: GGDEF domain-containing protein [unclassified Clostridium]EKQ51299.1 MAG: diguanylate cyclase (GGDEF) domain-containing protein [Clostridium sp. Maddingley MBC34-26]
MVWLSKLIIFLFVSFLLIYMIWINYKVLNKFVYKKKISVVGISGLGLILAASFLDMISNLIHIEIENIINIFLVIGVSIFVTYLILWINCIVKVISTLNRNANNDPMTGLYNRKGLEKVFERKISTGQAFFIMAFDLDKTKMINDSLGHLVGDKYIISSARIIKNRIGKKGVVARTGGDEFIAIIENISEKEIENIKLSIKNGVSHIFSNQNTQVSIGYSKYTEDGITLEDLMNIADKRMYEEKRSRKERLLDSQENII